MTNDAAQPDPDDDGETVDELLDEIDAPEELDREGRDADEREADDLLELDQTELEETGLLLDDPHQPEEE